MSLFPAYSANGDSVLPSATREEQTRSPTAEDRTWLSLSDFPRDLGLQTQSSSKGSSEQACSDLPKRSKKKKHRHGSRKREIEKLLLEKAQEKMEEILSSDSPFHIDRKGSRDNILIPTLMKNDAPMYRKTRKGFVSADTESKKKRDKWRYFRCSANIGASESDMTVTKQSPPLTNEDFLTIGNASTQSSSIDTESRISKTVASYNQQLTEDPHNEELWLAYVDYQDEIKGFEKRYKKAAQHSTACTEKKLSIVDKALSHNPLSEILLLRKLDLLHETNDLDKVSEELYSMLRQDFGNLSLWIRYIQLTQSTVSRCSVQKVMALYATAMQKINFMQKHGLLMTELQLIELFTRCALFLRQAGLWEQLCMLVRLNLQLNLSDSGSDHYKVDVPVPEDSVQRLEDEILTCGLPIYSLWLRLEKVRERVHWYPISDAGCDDPQRVVVPTDVTDLIRPITTHSLSLRVAITTLHLLKVPLMPLRDCIFRVLGLSVLPSHLDSCEVLLSAFGSISITQGRFRKLEEAVISCLKDLVSHPQYVNDELGRSEFLEFIERMFKKISRNLPAQSETILLGWWLRFERALLTAGKQPAARKKRLKSSMKELLKEERHRNSLPLFIEYALLEKELAEKNGNGLCLKILETALSMHPAKRNYDNAAKASLTQLYRVTLEVLLLDGCDERCIRLLVSLALAIPEKEVKLNQDAIKTALAKYQQVTDEMMAEGCYTDELELDQLGPQFFVEWVMCEAWFLSLTESVWSACAFLQHLLHKLPKRDGSSLLTVGAYYRELITETLITILHRHCDANKTAYNLLNEGLRNGIEEFPNNMLFLCTLFDLETRMNFVSPWWRIEKCLGSNDSVLAKVIMILLCRRRLIAYEETHRHTREILGQVGTTFDTGGFNNRVRSLLVKLTADTVTKQCPLIWMIYMQYCALYENDDKYKDVFHMAIENCPWVKVLYMEAAQVLLDQASQIQDLMVEKELRIHITQDEIDILRE